MDDDVSTLLRCRAVVGESRTRLVVAGEIDLATADHLGHFLDAHLLAAAPGNDVLVDLAGVEFCSAIGVRVLMNAARRARARRVRLRLHPRSAAIELALAVCGRRAEIEIADRGARHGLRLVRPSARRTIRHR